MIQAKTGWLGMARPSVAEMQTPLVPFSARDEKQRNGEAYRICPGCFKRRGLEVEKCGCGRVLIAPVQEGQGKGKPEKAEKDKRNSGRVLAGTWTSARTTPRVNKKEGKSVTLKRVPESAHKFLGVAADGRKIFNLIG